MGSQILRSKAPGAPTKPLAPNYHALATPILYRRFVRASWTTATVAYVGNILMENTQGWPWSALPFGWAGFNTFVLFLFLVPVLILRMGQISTISRKGLSDIHTIVRSVGDYRLFKCIFFYWFSAFLIIQFYSWIAAPSSDLSLTTRYASYEPAVLNERRIYLSYYALPLAVIQSLIHIWTDRDYLKMKDESTTFSQAFSESFITSLQRIGTSVIVSIASGPIFYPFLRQVTRSMFLLVVAPFTKLHNEVEPYPMSDQIDLFIRRVWLTILIVFAWETTNISFSVEFEKGPIRDGKTISEISPDPNGSLILGLKLKTKPLSRRMAFKELAYIANEDPTRRETIFKDLTKPLNSWQQILAEAKVHIKAISTNLVPPPDPVPETSVNKPVSPLKEIKDFNPQRPSDENVLRTPVRKTAVDKWQATPDAMPTSPINLDKIKEHLVSKETIESKIYETFRPVFYSEYGDLFRLTIQRKTTSLLPDASLQVDAINALVGFICASLKEDKYGMVQKDLHTILEELTNTASVLEAYIATPPLHWTDIHAKTLMENQPDFAKKELFLEPVILLDTINDGLAKFGDTFDQYLEKLGLSVEVRRKIRLVREAAKSKSN